MLNDKIKSLIELLEKSDINEIEVSTFWGHQKIKLKKNPEQVVTESLADHTTQVPASQDTSIHEPIQKTQVDPATDNDNPVEDNISIADIRKELFDRPDVRTKAMNKMVNKKIDKN